MAAPENNNVPLRSVKPLRDPFGPISDRKTEEPKKIYPKITIPLDTLPEAKEWSIGESYALDIEVVMTGIRQDEYSNEATFELRKIGVEDEAEEDDEAGA